MASGDEIRLERNGKLSASELDACAMCPARFLRSKDIAEESKNTSAKRGAKLHKALEHSSLEGLSPSDASTVDILMDKESMLVDQFGLEKSETHRERRFWMADQVSAKVDVIYHTKDVSLIIDYKTGWIKKPELEHGLQIDCQVVCASCELKSFAYVSALLTPISHYYKVYDDQDLLKAESEIVDVCERSYAGGEATPNKLSCKFCLAKNICEEYRNWVDK